jgi:hypothetical protein
MPRSTAIHLPGEQLRIGPFVTPDAPGRRCRRRTLPSSYQQKSRRAATRRPPVTESCAGFPRRAGGRRIEPSQTPCVLKRRSRQGSVSPTWPSHVANVLAVVASCIRVKVPHRRAVVLIAAPPALLREPIADGSSRVATLAVDQAHSSDLTSEDWPHPIPGRLLIARSIVQETSVPREVTTAQDGLYWLRLRLPTH